MSRVGKILKDNRGLTFIEMLVAFGILGVLMSVAAFSLGLPAGTQAKEVTYNIDAMLSRTKTGTLAKTGDVFMVVRMNEKSQIVVEYFENGILKEYNTVSDAGKVAIHYELTNSSGGSSSGKTELTSGKAICIGFDRRSSGFVDLKTSNTAHGSSSSSSGTVVGGSAVGDYCKRIYISAVGVEYEIVLGIATGTHTCSLG